MKITSVLFVLFVSCIYNVFSQNRNTIDYVAKKGIIHTYQGKEKIRSGDISVRHIHTKDSVSILTSAKTDYAGTFTLTIPFRTTKYRDPARISVHFAIDRDFKNYKVVNEDVINNVSSNERDTIKIMIARKDIMKQSTLDLEQNLISSNHIKIEQLKQELLQTCKDKQKLEDSLRVLQKEKEEYETMIKTLYDRIERMHFEIEILKNNQKEDIAELINNHATAIRLFLKGQLDSALTYCDSSISKEKLEQLKAIHFASTRLKALIYQVKKKHEEVLKYYIECITYYDYNKPYEIFCNHIDIAEMGYLLGHYDEAKDNLVDALSLWRINDIYKIKAHNLQWKIAYTQWKMTYKQKFKVEFITAIKEAIKKYKSIKKENNNEIIPIADKEAAISYLLLAGYYAEKGKYETAKMNYLKALDIYIALNSIGEIEIENQKLCLLNLAYLYQLDNKTSLVDQCLYRVKLLSDTTQNSLIQSERDATIYMAIADLSLIGKEFSIARAIYSRVLDFYQELNSQCPIIYESELIKTYFCLGMAYYYQKDTVKKGILSKIKHNPTGAIKYLEEGLNFLKNSSIDTTNIEYKKFELLFNAAIGNAYDRAGYSSHAEKYFNRIAELKNTLNDRQLNIAVDSIDKYGKGLNWDEVLKWTKVSLSLVPNFGFMLYLF